MASKYKEILQGKVLDVGCDKGYISQFLRNDVEYYGIDLKGNGENIIGVDLEREEIPYSDKTFDCVMCLDVLEHLENIHQVFDKLCTVSKKYVLISLPNPYNDLFTYLKSGKYMGREKNMKFYGLPKNREEDRHKWFFSAIEAREFVNYRAELNGFHVLDFYANGNKGLMRIIRQIFTYRSFSKEEITIGTMWFVLERNED